MGLNSDMEMEKIKFDVEWIAGATGGKLLSGSEKACIGRVCIDSREAGEGAVFIPVVGGKNDAHNFIPEVFKAGCRVTLTSRRDIELIEGMTYILVDDTVKALQDMAGEYRRDINIPLIGITGSVGKTTTREMVAAALSAGYKTFKTPANRNSQIGVPLTIFEIDKSYEIAVIEMGMSEPGEMRRIAGIVRPDTVLLTNIGLAHIEQLHSKENILKEKLHISDFMKPGAEVYLNAEDSLLSEAVLREGLLPRYYGSGKHTSAYASDIDMSTGCPEFTANIGDRKIHVKLSVFGEHQVLNALAALSVAAGYDVDLEAAAAKLSQFKGFKHRQQIFEGKSFTVIDDTYNASPDSMKAAVNILAGMKNRKTRIAILADMKELGENAELCHREIGDYINSVGNTDRLILVGKLAAEIGKRLDELGNHIPTEYLRDDEELNALLEKTDLSDTAVLLKGSNSMRLYTVADRLAERTVQEQT